MTIRTVTDHGITTITIDRQSKLNALDFATIDALHSVLRRTATDDETQVVILTGAGDRAFSAGADVNDLSTAVAGGVHRALHDVVERGQGLTRSVENFPKPLIAAVNGLAFGGGCEIVEAAALAVASEHATFAKPEITLGFPPPFGGSQRLPRHVGRKRALEMILTGDAISAPEAARRGLVNHVVPAHELMERAVSLALRITRHDPVAVRACLTAVTRGINVPIDEGLAVEAAWFGNTVIDGSASRGMQRFLTRKRP